MDPLSLIVAALAAGAAAGVKDTAGRAVNDAYGGLKSLLGRKVADRPHAQEAIEKHSEAPKVWGKPLQDQLGKAGVGDDEEVVRAAQRLLALVDPGGAQAGKYNVTVAGGKGSVVGDYARVDMTFADSSRTAASFTTSTSRRLASGRQRRSSRT